MAQMLLAKGGGVIGDGGPEGTTQPGPDQLVIEQHVIDLLQSATAAEAATAIGAAGPAEIGAAVAAYLIATPPVVDMSTAWPVGSIFIGAVSTSPAILLGFGTWVAFGAGRVLVGRDAGDADFDTAEETGGAKTKTIAQANLPNINTGAGSSHNHTQNAHTHDFLPRSATTGAVSSIVTGTLDTSSTISGANQPHIQAQTAVNQPEAAHSHPLGGSGTALNVMNPYIVVYFWKRTA